jgi:histidine triad (HIT) family protein
MYPGGRSDEGNAMTKCVFCEIAGGRAPAAICHRDAHTTSFLDARPLFPGHVLVVPNEHVETLSDLPPALVEPLFAEVRRTSLAVERAMGAGGSFVAMNNRVSQSVPHLHVHVVPRTKGDGLRGFFWPRHTYATDEERERVRAAIESALTIEER